LAERSAEGVIVTIIVPDWLVVYVGLGVKERWFVYEVEAEGDPLVDWLSVGKSDTLADWLAWLVSDILGDTLTDWLT